MACTFWRVQIHRRFPTEREPLLPCLWNRHTVVTWPQKLGVRAAK